MENRLIYMDDTVDKLRAYAERKHEAGHIELANGILKAVNYIRNNIVRVDAVEVVHGHWIERQAVNGQVYCSECATIEKVTDSNYKSRRCPNCGAKMDGERRNNGTESEAGAGGRAGGYRARQRRIREQR